MRTHITIRNTIDALPVLAEQIETLGEQWELPLTLTMNLNLVLEEAVTNIVFYAYPDKGEHTIDVILTLEDNVIGIELVDDGIPFDPTRKEDPDVTLPVEERSIGGLGIFLITKLMDEVSYKRENEKNILFLKKKLRP
ncbi:MAG TPA: ATP-binding protein [Prolixibacteraceae bacterium]|nr:ATP-binding protein [Prolixibacteraceae bacterium]